MEFFLEKFIMYKLKKKLIKCIVQFYFAHKNRAVRDGLPIFYRVELDNIADLIVEKMNLK